MLTPSQLQQLKTGASGQPAAGQAMTPEQARAWAAGTPQTPGYLSRVGSDIKSNVEEGANTLTKTATGELNPLSGGAGMFKNVMGAAAAPFTEALQPAMEKVNPIINKIADKVSDSKAVQAFADLIGKHPILGQTIQDLTEGGLNEAGLLAGGGETAKVGAEIPKAMESVKSAVKTEAPKPEVKPIVNEAHDLIDKEVRNTAEKYGDVGKALNHAEVTKGSEPIKVLSSYAKGEALPTMNKGGKMNSLPAINFLREQVKTLGKLKGNLVGTAKGLTPIKDFQKTIFDKIDKSPISAVKKTAQKADVSKILNDMKETYPKGIPAEEMDRIKTEQANESGSYKKTGFPSRFNPDSHSLVADTARTTVAKQGGEAPIDELNKWISSHHDAIKVLEKMHGKTPHGGMFSRHMGGIAGEVAGLAGGIALGHPFIGAMAGRGASEIVNNIISSHFISNPLKRALVTSMKDADPAVVQKALDFLATQEKAPGGPTVTPKSSSYDSSVSDKNTHVNGYSGPMIKDQPTRGNGYAGPVPSETPQTVIEGRFKPASPKDGGGGPETPKGKESERGFVKNPVAALFNKEDPGFKGFSDLSLTTLEKDLKGRTTVSKQFIQDLTNKPELKQPERDLLREVLKGEGNTVNVQEFANKVKAELLPLTRNFAGSKYENHVLPSDLRGPMADYSEHVYESPIKTSAGNNHYPNFSNYFGHTRIEDLPNNAVQKSHQLGTPIEKEELTASGGDTRRVIELQSDLFQKGGLEGEVANAGVNMIKNARGALQEVKRLSPKKEATRLTELSKLESYVDSNDTAGHFRMLREEVKQAAKDGKTKLQFPTGETAMKIEGLGQSDTFSMQNKSGFWNETATADNLKVGAPILRRGGNGVDNEWIITDVLEDGKFKAVPKTQYEKYEQMKKDMPSEDDNLTEQMHNYAESFDISGKVDTENPIYKFYEKEVGRYLAKKYDAKRITDPQGVQWYELNVPKDAAKSPVTAFAGIGGTALAAKEQQN